MEEDFHKILADFMRRTGYSNYKIAKDTGITEQGIGKYVKGRNPSRIYKEKLLNYFDSVLNNETPIEVNALEPKPEYRNKTVTELEKELAVCRASLELALKQIKFLEMMLENLSKNGSGRTSGTGTSGVQ